MSAKCRHSLSGRQTWTVRSFEREERDFKRQQRFPMEGAIFWGIRFDARTRKIGESIRHGSVILMPFSRSTRPRPAARWFFSPSFLPPLACFLLSRLHVSLIFPPYSARFSDDDEEDGHSASRKQDHATPYLRQGSEEAAAVRGRERGRGWLKLR